MTALATEVAVVEQTAPVLPEPIMDALTIIAIAVQAGWDTQPEQIETGDSLSALIDYRVPPTVAELTAETVFGAWSTSPVLIDGALEDLARAVRQRDNVAAGEDHTAKCEAPKGDTALCCLDVACGQVVDPAAHLMLAVAQARGRDVRQLVASLLDGAVR